MTDNISIRQLVANIKAYNEAYRKGEPLVPDVFYDNQVNLLKQLDPDNDWFKQIEPAPVSHNRKIKLPIPMRSLYKVKNLGEIRQWVASLALNDSYKIVITPKFDGVSLLHNEQNGKTYSRGGADNEGQDCTAHYYKADFGDTANNLMYSYGEFVFSKKSWKDNFVGKWQEDQWKKYKSPRNTAAGLLNRDEPSELLKSVDFYRYGTDNESIHNFDTYEQFYCYVCETFNQPDLHYLASISNLTDDLLIKLFNDWGDIYYIDGLVLYVNDIKIWDVAGRQETTGNPNYAIAYKNPDFTNNFETTVQDVEWNISKSGAFKPVVKIDVVNTGDCEIDSPTGYNAKFINENRIAPGAVIHITRSGGVIPKIVKVIEPASGKSIETMWDKLTTCPHCGAPLAWNATRVELCCKNLNCKGIRLARIIFFYETIGIENVGSEIISKVFYSGYNTLRKMLDITFDELLMIDTIGVEVANSFLAGNAKIRQGVEVSLLMHASSCFPSIGQVKAKKILEEMTAVERQAFIQCQAYLPIVDNMTSQSWYVNASKTMQSFYDNVDNFYDFAVFNQIPMLSMEDKTKPTGDKYIDMKVCFTGVRDKQLEADIVAGGGTVVSGVSKNTTHLIVDSRDSQSYKTKKALQLHIPILTIEEFRRL